MRWPIYIFLCTTLYICYILKLNKILIKYDQECEKQAEHGESQVIISLENPPML